jgi:hypothetical protein
MKCDIAEYQQLSSTDPDSGPTRTTTAGTILEELLAFMRADDCLRNPHPATQPRGESPCHHDPTAHAPDMPSIERSLIPKVFNVTRAIRRGRRSICAPCVYFPNVFNYTITSFPSGSLSKRSAESLHSSRH